MAEVLHMDDETRSPVNLVTQGVYRYAEHHATTVTHMGLQFDNEPPFLWMLGQRFPASVIEHVGLKRKVACHNAGFERVIWNGVLRRNDHYGPALPSMLIEQQDCTMSRAAVLGLPQKLEHLCVAIGAPFQKDLDGHRLMMKMCRPRTTAEDGTYTWWEDEKDMAREGAYCIADVACEVGVDRLLPPLSAEERRVWELDQAINDRGVAIDIPMVRRALAAVEEAQHRADRRMWRLTNGAVRTCQQSAKIIEWINARGIPCESVAKGEIEELVLGAREAVDPVCEEVIVLRRAAARTSVKKLRTMLDCVCADGRVRGLLAYHSASTGRWAGRLVQPQNFIRVEAVDSPFKASDVPLVLDLLTKAKSASEAVDAIAMIVGEPMDSLSRCLRAMLVAGF